MIISKHILFTVSLFIFVFSPFMQLCHADIASDLSQVESFVKSGQFSQAEQLCQSIAQSNPGSDAALKAQAKLAAAYIMTGNMTQADSLVNTLKSAYSANPELPAILYGVMQRFKQARDFQRAENLSQSICQSFPASEQAQRIQLDTGKEQALQLIANGKFAEAEGAVNNMTTSAGSNPAMSATLFKIAREFKEAGRYDETSRIYQKIAQDYSNSDFAGKARMGADKLRIWNLIKAGDVSGAQAGLSKLINDYKDEDDLVHTVHGVGLKLEENGFYSQAKAVYEKVKTDYVGDKMAEMATVDLVKCDIRAMVSTASLSEVTKQLSALKTTFANHWYLPKAIWQIGAEYYTRAMKLESQGSAEQAKALYQNAADIWETVINNLPRSSSTAEACNYAAICYEKLGEYAKANACYQKAVDDYPGYRMRWNMIFMAGRNYEKMKKAGTLSAAEADTQMRTMYEKLLAEYPNCKVADYVSKSLGR